MTVDVVVWKQAMRKHPGMLTAREAFVGLALTLWMNREGSCRPSLTTIGNTVGVSADTIRRGVYELAHKGWLEMTSREGKPSILQAAVPPDLDVDTYAIIAQPNHDPLHQREGSDSHPLHQREGSISTTPSTSARGDDEPLAPMQGVTPSTGATPRKYDPDPLHPRDPNSIELSKTTSNSSVLRGRAREAEEVDAITPQDRPDLWEQAQHATTNAPGIKNPDAYRLAIFKRLIAEEQQHELATIHAAEIDACPDCTTTGLIVTEDENGRTVTYPCTHQGATA